MHALFPNLFTQLNLFLLEFANTFSATNSQKVEEKKQSGLDYPSRFTTSHN